jgi:predicted transcriptional regulator
MSTEISADSERYLEQVVSRGIYRDRAAAIDEALALLKRRDQLRSDVRAGIEQADRGELLDAEGVFQRLLARAHQIESSARAKA